MAGSGSKVYLSSEEIDRYSYVVGELERNMVFLKSYFCCDKETLDSDEESYFLDDKQAFINMLDRLSDNIKQIDKVFKSHEIDINISDRFKEIRRLIKEDGTEKQKIDSIDKIIMGDLFPYLVGLFLLRVKHIKV